GRTPPPVRIKPALRRPEISAGLGQPPQNIVKNTAVFEVENLVLGIDPAKRLDLLDAAIVASDAQIYAPPGCEFAHARDGHSLGAGQLELIPAHAVEELQRQHAHADQVRAMDALEAFSDHSSHAKQARALGGPVARGAGAVFLAGEDDEL